MNQSVMSHLAIVSNISDLDFADYATVPIDKLEILIGALKISTALWMKQSDWSLCVVIRLTASIG